MKKKILQFSVRDNMGGQTQYILNTWKYTDKNRFQFDFVTFAKKLSYEEELTRQGCKVHYMTVFAEENKELFIKELDAILTEGYDAIHIHTPHWKSTLVEERAQIAGIPRIIIHGHSAGLGMMDSEESKMELQQHCAVKELVSPKMAHVFGACSWKSADWLYGDKIPRDSVQILKNAIDVEKFAYDEVIRQQYRKDFDIEDKYVIGHVGRYVYAKNHDFIVDFLIQIVSVRKEVVLLLIGDGPEKKRIEEKIQNNRLGQNVIFLSKRNDVAQLMQMMDVFILPSNYEGFPIVLTEAQAADLPCIASDNVTLECNIIDRVDFLPLETEKWVQKVISLMEDKTLRRDRSEDMMQAGYDLKDAVREVEKIYEN